MVRRVRQITEKKIGEEGGAWVHQSSRNRADTLADVADSGEQLSGLAASLRRGKERDERGETGVLIARLLMTLTRAE
jgi:hypothetical protein